MSASNQDKTIRELLDFDPLANAEQVTGRSYKDHRPTAALGFLSHAEHAKDKEALLESSGDTTLYNKLGRYIDIIKAEGFTEVYKEGFKARGTDESFFVYWNDEKAILLPFDTYGGDSVNGGNFYYNWKPRDDNRPWSVLSSGRTDESGVWIGHHDCREALRFNIRQLEVYGDFVSPWAGDPRPWLSHHGDRDNLSNLHSTRDLIRRRLLAMPARVREKISVFDSPTERGGTDGE